MQFKWHKALKEEWRKIMQKYNSVMLEGFMSSVEKEYKEINLKEVETFVTSEYSTITYKSKVRYTETKDMFRVGILKLSNLDDVFIDISSGVAELYSPMFYSYKDFTNVSSALEEFIKYCKEVDSEKNLS